MRHAILLPPRQVASIGRREQKKSHAAALAVLDERSRSTLICVVVLRDRHVEAHERTVTRRQEQMVVRRRGAATWRSIHTCLDALYVHVCRYQRVCMPLLFVTAWIRLASLVRRSRASREATVSLP